jgi:hypothetical protein
MILIDYIYNYIYTISDSIAMRLLFPISSWPNDLSLRHSSGELTICDGTSALKPIRPIHHRSPFRILGCRTSARKYVRLFFRAWRNTAMWLKFHEKKQLIFGGKISDRSQWFITTYQLEINQPDVTYFEDNIVTWNHLYIHGRISSPRPGFLFQQKLIARFSLRLSLN